MLSNKYFSIKIISLFIFLLLISCGDKNGNENENQKKPDFNDTEYVLNEWLSHNTVHAESHANYKKIQ